MFNNSILSHVSTFSSLKGIYLNNIGLKGVVDLQELDSLSNLEELYMGGNEIKKIVFSKGETSWRKLTWLGLSNMSISDGNSLLQTLGLFPSLKSFEFYDTNFSGAVITNELPSFKNLTHLTISDTVFNNKFLQMIEGMTSLQSIEISSSNLNISDTLFDKGICKMLHLQHLDMWDNDFMGTLPCCLANLTSLQHLDISSNHFTGTLPCFLANLTSLLYLDISSNNFTGNISLSPLKVLTSIQDLRLSDNHFQIPVSLEPFFNHSKLKKFYGYGNEIYAGIESQYLAPKFQLNDISLSNCGYNGSFPKFLYSQHDLQVVDLSDFNSKGKFPVWLLNNNTKLEELYLVNNSLSGPLQLPIHPHMSLQELDISINSFHGHIPTEFGAYLPMLQTLNISRNALNGSIPSSFGDMKLLEYLDLSYNLLTGGIPEHLAMDCVSLEVLALSNNSLQGQIFPTNFNLKSLLYLQLDNNNFIGKIPDGLSNCSLEGLYISGNHLVGTLPRWLGNQSSLEEIIMSKNHLEGPIVVIQFLSSGECFYFIEQQLLHRGCSSLVGSIGGACSVSNRGVTTEIVRLNAWYSSEDGFCSLVDSIPEPVAGIVTSIDGVSKSKQALDSGPELERSDFSFCAASVDDVSTAPKHGPIEPPGNSPI
ncbi:receptor-like protein 13 [Pistacia vera]|uniref:receptor-like protein 13 n=1 Tax=Pistacia vera TaxID=55513 RepID=UPI0012634A1E|nr:receptor-like protein 13 [Pistacia vera]